MDASNSPKRNWISKVLEIEASKLLHSGEKLCQRENHPLDIIDEGTEGGTPSADLKVSEPTSELWLRRAGTVSVFSRTKSKFACPPGLGVTWVWVPFPSSFFFSLCR